ncbi:MAG: phage terminase large subunit [Moraxellaceae bacterium]
MKRDFKNFMFKTWMTLFGNAPTRLMYDVGDYLQFGPRRSIVMGFRGLSKSYVTVDFGVWTLYCDPTEIVLTVSGSGDGAKGNAALAYSMINNFDWLAHMKPRGSLRQSAQAFDVPGTRHEKSESFAAMSLFGQVTGRRASLILPDDCETPNTSATEGDRKSLEVRFAELGGAILKPGGRIKVLGTSQTEQTLYVNLAQNKGYGMRMWPVTYPIPHPDPKKDEVRKFGPWLAPTIRLELEANPELAGTSVEPGRFTEDDLFERLLEYGTTEYERQFKLWLDAGAGTAKPLHLRDIPIIEMEAPHENAPLLVPRELRWDPSPANAYKDIEVDSLNGDSTLYAPSDVKDWIEPEKRVLIIDPSGGGEDETAWGILAQLGGRVFLARVRARLEGFSSDTLDAIVADAVLYRPHEIRIEKNYGGGMFGELLRPKLMAAGVMCPIIEETAGQVQKEVRMVDTLEALVTGHRLVVAAEVFREDFGVSYESIPKDKHRNYRLSYQITRVTKKKGCLPHDDRLDMLATGVASFMGTLKRVLDEAAKESRDLYLQAEAEKIIETRRKQGQPLFGHEAKGYSKLGEFVQTTGGLASSLLFPGRR